VINGRPALWGDAVIALVRASPLCEYIYETDDGNTATIRVKRRGEEEQVRSFSMDDAKTAGLAGKQGPWSQYPKRMRQMRARAFALRDVFPDVLRGMPVAEEILDMHPAERDMGPAVTTSAPAQPLALPSYSDAEFEEKMAAWRDLVESGRATPERIIQMSASKVQLTEEQKQAIRELEGTQE